MLVNEFSKPSSVREAAETLSKCAVDGVKARVLAGGTDLVIALRERTAQADVLVDVSDVPEMKEIFMKDNVLHLGAACTFRMIESNTDILQHCPMLAVAASSVGAPTIRSRATVGGNVVNAATAADSIPVLLTADASARIVSLRGERVLPVRDIVVGINKSSLVADEILAELLIPTCTGSFTAFEKIGRRKALAISRINLATKVIFAADRSIQSAAVSVGAVGKTAYRVPEVENFLYGKELSDDIVAAAANIMDETVARNLGGRKTTPYKRKIASAVLKRALFQIMEVTK